MFETIKTIIDEWDPIGLLATHSPPDEYDLETREIVNFLNQKVQLDELSIKIYDIFVKYFGNEIFDKTQEECKIVAEKIIKTIKR